MRAVRPLSAADTLQERLDRRRDHGIGYRHR